ncbi:hypothetical protein [Salirhabdus salicampi]|uniref:hypothetical protein n=1 Tax=Salirhabdus salicampi TaxID=476102 RepID=UPI0020C4D811|nr:hypothetical protein [Salirhabdus salicampi]MCP8615555.1 hypothetical protein [Salirhabdus salicampi]
MSKIESRLRRNVTAFHELFLHYLSLFKSWLDGPVVHEFVKRYPYHTYCYLILTPIFMMIPIFSLFGSFHLVTYHYLASLGLFVFAICFGFIFMVIPYIFIHVLYHDHVKWRKLKFTFFGLSIFISICWIIVFYSRFYPNFSF